jgi:hypothetical protein
MSSNWITPDLARNPSLAFDVSNQKNPNGVADLVSHTAKTVAVTDAVNNHIANNDTQGFWSKLGHGAITGLEMLGKPLQEIQKDYKFNHAVYTDHGFLQGFAVTLGIIGGGIGGTFLGGPVGTVLGADLAATALRRLSTVSAIKDNYKDSYAKSEDPNYKVSPGRDFSNALATAVDTVGPDFAVKALKNTNTGVGKIVSGVGDLGFDVTADPVMMIGKFGQLMRGGKYLKLDKAAELQLRYPIMNAIPGVKDFLAARTGVALTSEQMDAVYKGTGIFNATARNYRAALTDISNSTAGEIIQKYPTLGTSAAGRLGKIDTPEGVHQFLKESLFFSEQEGTLAGQAMLPTRTLLKAKLGDSQVIDYLRNDGSLPGKVYKTFSGYMPYSVDPKTLELSTTKFRWNANDAATVVYRIARFGMGDSAAKEWAGKYAEAVAVDNQALARSIKNQAIYHTLLAAGLPADNAIVSKAWEEVSKLGEPLVSSQIYGVHPSGNTIGEYVTNGQRKVGAIFEHQATDMFNIPDFREIKTALHEAGLFTKAIGKADDFVSKRYTDKIFKPLALATAGFGLRVAAAEMIPTFARYGVINTAKAKIATTVAKSGYNLVKGEDEHIIAAALTSLGAGDGIAADVLEKGFPAFKEAKRRGLNFAAKMVPADQIDIATKLMMANDAHILAEAVSTGHGYDVNNAYQASQAAHYYYQIQKNSPLYRDLPEYTTYSPSDKHFVPRYVTTLNKASKDIAQRNISRDALQVSQKLRAAVKEAGAPVSPAIVGEEFHTTKAYQEFREALVNREYARMLDATKGTFKGYNEEMKTLTRWRDSVASGDLRTFASDRVDATLGMLMGKDGTFHTDFARNIAEGRNTDINTVAEIAKSKQQAMPRSVAGPMLQSYVEGTTGFEKLINIGFKKFIDPIVNNLSRETLYTLHVADAYARLAPRIGAGFTEDQALRIAQTQAVQSMLPQIHNVALRSQFAQIARNFLPFYFAQEQALKRAFNSLKDTSIVNPVFSRSFRFYQLAEQSLNDPGFVQSDENGNKYIYLPVVGAFGEGLQSTLSYFGANIQSGLPITAKGSLISLKSVLPELQMPGVSPFVAVGGNLITNFFPAAKPIIDKGIGSISVDRGIADTIIPAAWAKTFLSAASSWAPGGGIDLNRQMGNAIASALATAYYNGKVPGPDSNEFERQAFVDRIKNNARSILAIKIFLNLTSPLAPTVSQEDSGFRDEFWKLVKSKGNYADALQTFLNEHGDTAISYTVAKTYSNVPGAKVPYIQPTIDFIKNNHQLFDIKNGTSSGAFFLVPQDGIQDQSSRTVYNELMAMHFRSQRTPEELLKQFYIAQGDQAMSEQIQQHLETMKTAVDPFSRQQERTRWSGIVEQMKNFFPIWYKDYTSGGAATNAQTAYNQIVKILSSDQNPNDKQSKLVGDLVNKYQQHQQEMAQFQALNLQGFMVQQTKENWNEYLTQLSVDEPRLTTVINSVFMKLG